MVPIIIGASFCWKRSWFRQSFQEVYCWCHSSGCWDICRSNARLKLLLNYIMLCDIILISFAQVHHDWFILFICIMISFIRTTTGHAAYVLESPFNSINVPSFQTNILLKGFRVQFNCPDSGAATATVRWTYLDVYVFIHKKPFIFISWMSTFLDKM